MKNVATIITNPAIQQLDERIINKVFIALEKHGAAVDNIKWLAENQACDIFFSDLDINTAKQALGIKLEKIEADFIVQRQEGRQKKMLISDMDSTIINQECIDEIAGKLGLKDKVAEITDRAMNGELDFKESLRARVALLKGLDAAALDDVYKNIITFMAGARELVSTMKQNGAYCVLVSGGFTFFTDKVAAELGFDEARANTLIIKDGKLTGEVAEPILDKDSKLQALNEITARLGISADEVLAVGDGANDLPMLKGAGLGIAYHAKPNVRKEAGNKIEYTDLKSLIFAVGYRF